MTAGTLHFCGHEFPSDAINPSHPYKSGSQTCARLARGVALKAGVGPAVMIVSRQAILHAATLAARVDEAAPTTQAVGVGGPPTAPAGRVTALARHATAVAEMTRKGEMTAEVGAGQ